jgi:halocyanin-like protein
MSESSATTGAGAVRTDDGAGLGRRDLMRVGLGAAAATGATAAATPAAAQAYGEWMSDVSNYEATVDYTGQESVTVAVGAGENGVLFDPPAILVDPGTTVTWEWTGKGDQHNVVHQPEGEDGDPAFESELMEEAGATFERTLEEETAFRYYCDPHRAAGMKAVVAVGSTEDELVDPDPSGGPLTTSDLLVLAAAVGLGVALVIAVAAAADSPGGDRSV